MTVETFDADDVIGSAVYVGICLHEREVAAQEGRPMDPEMETFLRDCDVTARGAILAHAAVLMTDDGEEVLHVN